MNQRHPSLSSFGDTMANSDEFTLNMISNASMETSREKVVVLHKPSNTFDSIRILTGCHLGNILASFGTQCYQSSNSRFKNCTTTSIIDRWWWRRPLPCYKTRYIISVDAMAIQQQAQHTNNLYRSKDACYKTWLLLNNWLNHGRTRLPSTVPSTRNNNNGAEWSPLPPPAFSL